MARLRFDAHPLHRRERVVHPLEVIADRLHRDRIVRSAAALARYASRSPKMTAGRADLFIRRPRAAGLGAFALHLAALVEEVLNPGAGGVIGDEVELVPEPVQLLLPFSSRISSISGVSSRKYPITLW